MNAKSSIQVLAISGSLRKDSFNTASLRAVVELAPDDMSIRIRTLEDIPPYNEDVRAEGNPDSVEALRAEIAGADALLIATPEYNASMPGVLKNAIDWVSRPPDQPFDGKPVAILGATPGRLGTARAQSHLRQSLVILNALVLNRPSVMIGGARSIFDESGRLADESTREQVEKLLDSFARWVRKLT